MGKNHRHKKQVKSEKAKVQLKVKSKTKFLPKGQNITDTTFKVKPIVIKEQLKEKDGDVPLSKRNLNLQELLQRVKHYNENVKADACEDLCYLLKTYQEEDEIQKNLSQIIQSISVLAQERERKVRKAFVKVVDILLEKINADKIEPFFGYFSTNLRCAMTNIDKNVQEDSILLLDLFIKHAPILIVKNCDKILPDFLTLISKFRNEFGVTRTLTMNLASKHTSVGWRIKILSRLYAILKAISSFKTEKHQKQALNNAIDINENSSFELLKNISGLNGICSIDFVSNTIVNNTEINFLHKHLTTLVPLMNEIWMEVAPEKTKSKELQYLTEEASCLLCCILNVFYLLYEFVKNENVSEIKNVFLSKEGEAFLKQMLVNFPYSQANRPKQKKNADENDVVKLFKMTYDVKCTQENLLICFMHFILYASEPHKIIKGDILKIEAFLTKTLLRNVNHSEACYDLIFKILRHLLIEKNHVWSKKINIAAILENTIIFSQSLTKNKQIIVMDILVNINDEKLLQNPKYVNWIQNLPNLLCQKQIHESEIEHLLWLSRKNNMDFLNSFSQNMDDILDNLDTLEIISVKNTVLQNRDKIVNIFYYVPNTKVQNEKIELFLNDNLDSEFRKPLGEIFKFKLALG